MNESRDQIMEEEEDRISQLPDSILHVIISLIDIHEAVQTGIFSKRWRFLWSSMSQLHFKFYRHTRVNSANRPILPHESTNRFTHFVTQFLSHRDPASAVTKFHLSLRGRSNKVQDPTFVPRCVDYAATHGVRNLDIHVLRPPKFPDSFFACETLRDLTLRCFEHGRFVIPRKISLPNLAALCVGKSSFHYDGEMHDAAEEPFSAFPNLEKLSLRRCDVHGLIIFAPKLKYLEITLEEIPGHRPLMARISTPVLTTLRYQGFIPLECSKVELPTLEELCIETSRKFGRRSNGDDRRDAPLKCVRMLQQFGNAKVVTLALDMIQVLETDPCLVERSPSPFSCIRCLKLTNGRHAVTSVMRWVMDYLTACDESLVVELPEGTCVIESKIWGNLFDMHAR